MSSILTAWAVIAMLAEICGAHVDLVVVAIDTIARAAFVLGKRAIFDWPTTLIALLTLGILVRFKIPEPILILLTGVVGIVVFPLVG